MDDSIVRLPNVKIWSNAENNTTSLGNLNLTNLGITAADIKYDKTATVQNDLNHYITTPTGNNLLTALANKTPTEQIVIIPTTAGKGGGFLHESLATNDGSYHVIAYPASHPYLLDKNWMPFGHQLADPARSATRIYLPLNCTYNCTSLPSAIVLYHELGHAFQCLYARAKYDHSFRNSTIDLDALNIPIIERNILLEHAGPLEFICLRHKYGTTALRPLMKNLDPSAWNYGSITGLSSKIVNYSNPDLYLGKNDEAYDPKHHDIFMSKLNQRYNNLGQALYH